MNPRAGLSKASLIMAVTNIVLSVCAWLPFSAVLADAIDFIRAGWRSLVDVFTGSGKTAWFPECWVLRRCAR